MIKSIYFDLDGTLVETRDLHFHALNKALATIDDKFVISPEDHASTFDGLPTSTKLQILSKNRGLEQVYHSVVWKRKQLYTTDFIQKMEPDNRIIRILRELKKSGYTIYVASNAVYSTVKNILYYTGFLPYVDYFISNEEVKNPKPHPEMYQKCLARNKIYPHEALVIEDSPIGKKAALSSGCHLLPVSNSSELDLNKILDHIKKLNESALPEEIKFQSKLNVVIPMSGLGSRFSKVGFEHPKPLIDVAGKPMIQMVVDNLGCDPKYCRFIFIVQDSHYLKYRLNHLLNLIAPGCEIIRIDGVTEGAACSVLLAEKFIDNDDPLLTANADQYLDWDSNQFLYSAMAKGVDGCISTFISDGSTKWSFAKLDDDGFVSEVAEKKPISDIATTGIYFWRKGSDYVKYAKQMIEKDIKVNSEFYLCPVYNEAIADGKKIKIMHCNRFLPTGTPEDLQLYLETTQEHE